MVLYPMQIKFKVSFRNNTGLNSSLMYFKFFSAPRFSPAEIMGVPGGPNVLKLEWTVSVL